MEECISRQCDPDLADRIWVVSTRRDVSREANIHLPAVISFPAHEKRVNLVLTLVKSKLWNIPERFCSLLR
jgi:hypothetical protein